MAKPKYELSIDHHNYKVNGSWRSIVTISEPLEDLNTLELNDVVKFNVKGTIYKGYIDEPSQAIFRRIDQDKAKENGMVYVNCGYVSKYFNLSDIRSARRLK